MPSRYKNLKRRVKSKPFATIEIQTVCNEQWKLLNSTEAHTYNILKTFYRGQNQWFTAPFSALKERTRIKHSNTLDTAIRALESKGWVEVRRYAKHRKGLGVKCNEYKLTKKYDYIRW